MKITSIDGKEFSGFHFLQGKEYLIKLGFTESEIEEAIDAVFQEEDLVEKLAVPKNAKRLSYHHDNYAYQGIKEDYITRTVTVGGREYSNTSRELCEIFLKPYQYQPSEKILRYLLGKKIPFFNEQGFIWDVYSLRSSDYLEIYLRTENERPSDKLYVPVKALINNDFTAIKERNISYFEHYYAGEDRKKFLDNALKLLETYEFFHLKKRMTEPLPY